MSMKGKRPSHATVVAYLALFIALATGVSYAATKITSPSQIKKNVVRGKHVKNGALSGKDVKEGSLAGNDIKDGSIAGADIGQGSLGAGVLGAGSVGTAAIANGSVTGQDLNVPQLGFGQTYSTRQNDQVTVDNGGSFGSPQTPDGTVATLEVPAGKYLISAGVLVRSDGNDGGVLCAVFAEGENIAVAAGSTDEGNFGLSESTFDDADVTLVGDFNDATTLDYACSDGGSGDLKASARRIDAVKLPG